MSPSCEAVASDVAGHDQPVSQGAVGSTTAYRQVELVLYDDRVCAHHKDEEQQHLHGHDLDLVCIGDSCTVASVHAILSQQRTNLVLLAGACRLPLPLASPASFETSPND